MFYTKIIDNSEFRYYLCKKKQGIAKFYHIFASILYTKSKFILKFSFH
jgi:hypothetical protein